MISGMINGLAQVFGLTAIVALLGLVSLLMPLVIYPTKHDRGWKGLRGFIVLHIGLLCFVWIRALLSYEAGSIK